MGGRGSDTDTPLPVVARGVDGFFVVVFCLSVGEMPPEGSTFSQIRPPPLEVIYVLQARTRKYLTVL